MNRSIALFLILIVILFTSPAILLANEKTSDIRKTTWHDIYSDVVGHYPLNVGQANTVQEKGKLDIPKNWTFDLAVQRFLMSHTSFELGGDTSPYAQPLSRLEFPLNTWWLNFELRRTCPRWSVGFRAATSVASNTDGRFKDSDWEHPTTTAMLTTYSESACRLENSSMFRTDVDVNISDWLRLPPGLEIRPLFAFEFQRLSLMAHDGVQWSIGSYDDDDAKHSLDGYEYASALPGNSIHFRQDYYLYQIGLRGVYDGIKIGKYITIKATGEADWGPAVGYNKDNHILRNLFGFIKSSGNSLYFSAGLDMVFANTITAGISMDYLNIRTFGAIHDLGGSPYVDQWNGNDVKAWSDQTSLKAHVSYAF